MEEKKENGNEERNAVIEKKGRGLKNNNRGGEMTVRRLKLLH
jgi:hypothetical protein